MTLFIDKTAQDVHSEGLVGMPESVELMARSRGSKQGLVAKPRIGEISEEQRESDILRDVLAAHVNGNKKTQEGGYEEPLLTPAELAEIEKRFAEGVSAVQAVDIFRARGARFSEASFRKYVQLGLLPRSRRVGRKGKHRGSMGLYPTKTIRRINTIKRLMSEGYTIDEIQQQFLRYTNVVEQLEEGLTEIFHRLSEDVEHDGMAVKTKKRVVRELAEAQKAADRMMELLGSIVEGANATTRSTYKSTGAAGSAEDLL